MTKDPFFCPFDCPVWLRPAVFLGRIVQQRPREAIVVTLAVVALGLVEGLGLGLLLPLLSLLGVETGADATAPVHVVERSFAFVGIPLTLVSVLAVFFTLGLLQIALNAFQQYSIIRSGESLTLLIRRRLFDAASRARWTVLTTEHGAHLTGSASTEALRIGVLYGNAMTTFGIMFNFTIYASLAAWLSWRFTLLIGLAGMLSMLVLRRLYHSSRRFGAHTSAAMNKMHEILNEHVSAAKFIRALGAGVWSRSVFQSAATAVGQYSRRNLVNTVLVKTSVEPFGLIMLVAMIYSSIVVFRIPTAELMLLLLIFYRITPRLVHLQEMLQRITGMLPAYEQVSEIIKRLDEAKEPSGSIPFSGLKYKIELKRVVVRHGSTSVLNGVDMEIQAGTTVALVGPSGGGKSTLIDILTGVLQPDEGEVLVDNVPLSALDLTIYRQQIGILPQECVFFHDTIAVNLRVANPDASDEQIWEALASAQAEDFVRARQEGLDTVVGDRGLRLSGGQLQRLALARALLRKPTLLLLDEPTSALDNETEAIIRETLKRLHGSVTIVLVTHRIGMAQGADAVYRIEEGLVLPG